MADQQNIDVPEDATCLDCGYPLIRLPRCICPECGRTFDPADGGTFGCASSRKRWKGWAHPPGKAEYFVLVGMSILVLINVSGPARWDALLAACLICGGAPVWIGLGIAYFIRLAACYRAKARGVIDPFEPRHRLRWILIPVCMLLVGSSFLYPWPLLVRFRLSRPAFEAAVKDVRAGKFVAGQWVGLYHVKEIYIETYAANRPASIGFVIGESIADPVGFVYDPRPNHVIGSVEMRVAPSWYTREY